MSKIKEKSAGIVPIKLEDGEYLFLLLRSYNFWDFPKGRIEPYESALSAAIRETYEETTIPDQQLLFVWGTDSYTTEPYKKGIKTGTYFVAKTTATTIDLPYSEEIGKPEHEEFRWVTYEEGKKLTNKRIGGVLEWAYKKITESG